MSDTALEQIEAATERLNPDGPNIYREIRESFEVQSAEHYSLNERVVTLEQRQQPRLTSPRLSSLYAQSQSLLQQPRGAVPEHLLLEFIERFAEWARSL